MTDCLFCRIARGAVPAEIVHADDGLVAFLDVAPVRPGHALVVPRDHHATFDEMPEATAAAVVRLGQRLARGMKALHGVPRVAFLFTGNDVPHVHAHLIPMHESTDVTSRRYIAEETVTFRPVPRAEPAALAAEGARLRAALAAP